MPAISIIMSVYNGAKYLREAIDSILNQTFTDFEFIIINDGSTDKTGEILKQYDDDRIVMIHNNENIGLTKSLNKGIQISKGKYVARMDGDDISMAERIEKQVQFMEKNKNVEVLGTDYYTIDESGKRIEAKLRIPYTSEEIKKYIFLFNPFVHSSIMIRRSVIEELGIYDERFELAQDYELILRILSKYEGCNLKEELIAFRIDKRRLNLMRTRKQIYFSILARLKVLREGLYPKKNYIFLIKDFIKYIIPYYSFYKGKSKIEMSFNDKILK